MTCCRNSPVPSPWGMASEHLQLLQIVAIRIVVEVKTQREILPPILIGEWGEWIGSGNAAPGRAVERHITRRTDQAHACNLSVFRDRELDADFRSEEHTSELQ